MNLKTDQKRYRVFLDPSYEAEQEPGKTEELWRYYELRGKYGTIYPYSATHLAVLITSNKIASKTMRSFKDWPIIQSGDEETVLKAPDKAFLDAVQVIQARKRRIVDPSNAHRLAKYQFQRSSASNGRTEAK